MVQKLNVAYFKPNMMKMLCKKVPEDSSRGNFLKAIHFMHSFSIHIYTGLITLCLHIHNKFNFFNHV